MLHGSRNSGRDFWWNQLPCGAVLTPILCTKLKIHSVHEHSLIVPEQVFFKSCPGNLDEGPVYASQIKKLRKRFLVDPAPCGPVLTPISCTKLKIRSSHAGSPIVPKQVLLFNLVPAIWNVGPVFASQIKKLRKRFLVEPAPLWASSYTHLLYKARDPFRVCRQSNCP